MKKILCSCCALTIALLAGAQQKQGTVMYDRTAQMRMRIDRGNGPEDQVQNRTDKFELDFANNQSLWKQAEKETEDDHSGEGGMQIRMIVAGSDDVLFNDFNSGKATNMRVVFDKKFIVDDSVRRSKWKIGEDTKEILGHVCRNAATTIVSPRTIMNVDNGTMIRKEVQDTANVTAWFAADIPVSAGPAEYQGQLPGLILALDINNGRTVYQATTISEKTDLSVIKEPSGKKHYTPAEFKKERDKMMDEMQENNRGGRQIRIN